MKTGAHAVLFREKISTETKYILQGLRDAGAEITEIGSRFFGIERAPELCRMLDETGIGLGGVHAALKLPDFLDDPAGCRKYLFDVARFISETPCRRMVFTGNVAQPDLCNLGDDRLADPAAVLTIARELDSAALDIRNEFGIQIDYHNHNWEFKNGGLIYETLIDHAPDLFFALDIGWAGRSGYDPVDTIHRLTGRIDYIHLRDFSSSGEKPVLYRDIEQSYAEVGEGDLDLPAVLVALRDAAGDDASVMIEYEVGEESFSRIARALSYVRSILP